MRRDGGLRGAGLVLLGAVLGAAVVVGLSDDGAPSDRSGPDAAATARSQPGGGPTDRADGGPTGDGALFGAWVKPTGPMTPASLRAAVTDREQQLGRSFDLHHWYYPPGTPFPSWREDWSIERGATPLISWNGFRASEVVAGSHDDFIAARAAEVAALSEPVLIRYDWEMDGRHNAATTVDGPTWVAAWRRIVDAFRAHGADNVAWVWCPNADAFAGARGGVDVYYPGDDYVDWICADGYNWAPGRPEAAWKSLDEIFAAFHAWGTARGKPLMIGETGVQERGPGEKAAWLRELPEVLARDLPNVRAVVYFDADRLHPWQLDSSPEAQAAARAAVNHPYLTALDAATVLAVPAGRADGAAA